MVYQEKDIKFGTDGWRGVIAADFTLERVRRVAIAAGQVLEKHFGGARSKTVIVGHDRRFQADRFGEVAAIALAQAGFRVLLGNNYAPTPAFSWAAHRRQALGAIVLTASHNPANYLGLKVKGSFGGSVGSQVTAEIEEILATNLAPEVVNPEAEFDYFDPWEDYCQTLGSKVDLPAIQQAIADGQLQVWADVMHGAAAGGLSQILGRSIIELHCEPDPLFGGHAPEPLAVHLSHLSRVITTAARTDPEGLRVGFVFDGDCDRIAAMDGQGNFLSSQILIPILIAHLRQHHQAQGKVIKTVSGSDLIPRVAAHFGCEVTETPIGYKYIAEKMQSSAVLIGGEESGGVGYGNHIPERDALLSALYVLEAIVKFQADLGDIYRDLQEKTQCFTHYDRLDLRLSSVEHQAQLQTRLDTAPPTTIAGKTVESLDKKDGFKFRLGDRSWLLIRFSGTEPVLRLYSEALTPAAVAENLSWAQQFTEV